jgi:hypothetical protein
MQPPVPGLGGTMAREACRALALTLIRKSPLADFRMLTELTGPCSPIGSLY